MYKLPRRLFNPRNLPSASPLSKRGSVQLKVGDHRSRVARGNASLLDLSGRRVFGHGRELKLRLQSGSGRELGVSGDVLQCFSGHLMLSELQSLELVLDDPAVEVAVLGKLELDGESEWHDSEFKLELQLELVSKTFRPCSTPVHHGPHLVVPQHASLLKTARLRSIETEYILEYCLH